MRSYGYVEHWYPGLILVAPLLLLAASVAMLVTRWWSLLLAVLASARVIYTLGYLSWRAVHFAHDVPMLSWRAMEKLWHVVYQPRPQSLFEVILALVILVFSSAALTRLLFTRRVAQAIN